MQAIANSSSIKSKRKSTQKRAFDAQAFLDSAGVARRVVEYRRSQKIYSQGDPPTSVMYIQKGSVTLSVVNEGGKEAVVAILGPGDFLGEECLTGRPIYLATATTIAPTTVLVIEKNEMIRALHEEHEISDPLHRVYAGAKRTSRGRPDRPAFQFERETTGAHLVAAGPLWRAGPSSKCASQSIARDAGGDDWHNAAAGQFLHEQIQETGIHPIQRRNPRQQFPPESGPAGVSPNFRAHRKAAYFQITVGNRVSSRPVAPMPD